MDDAYLTIKAEATAEIKIKGSRFIGRTLFVGNNEELNLRLAQIRKLEYQATHNCYAYKYGLDAKKYIFKYSDDGEPNGTAGKPIYDVLNGCGATNLLLVVTRYYGGTKLGTGGLVSAYSECAKKVIEQSGTKENFITSKINVEIEFPLYDKLLKVTGALGAIQKDAEFSDKVKLQLEIRNSLLEQMKNEIINLSNGQAKIYEP